MNRTAIFALAMVASSPAFAQQQQFDLVCSGEQTSTTFDGEKVEPYSTRLRIDLAEERWCENECKAIHDLASVQPTQITLKETSDDGIDESSFMLHFVDRETGEHHLSTAARYRAFPRLTVSIKMKGTCSPEPFSGFPTFETKF